MISKTIHFVWPANDGKPLPDLYRRHIDQWAAMNPAFAVKLWDGSEFPEARCHREPGWSMTACSDEIRYRALHQDGGFYFDLDIRPLRPIPEWLVDVGGFLHRFGRSVIPAAMALPAGHPTLEQLIDCAENQPNTSKEHTNIGLTCLRKVAGESDLIQLPERYFLSRDPETAIYGVHGVRYDQRRNPSPYFGDPRPDPIKDRPCCDPPQAELKTTDQKGIGS